MLLLFQSGVVQKSAFLTASCAQVQLQPLLWPRDSSLEHWFWLSWQDF